LQLKILEARVECKQKESKKDGSTRLVLKILARKEKTITVSTAVK